MNENQILQTVVRYLAANSEELIGGMAGDNYFLVQGCSINEIHSAPNRIATGTAADVLSDTIEREDFFGWYVGESPDQATNPNNASLKIMEEGETYRSKVEFELTENGLYLSTDEVEEKPYIDPIRDNPNSFESMARGADVRGDLERMTDELYRES